MGSVDIGAWKMIKYNIYAYIGALKQVVSIVKVKMGFSDMGV